VIYGNKIHAVLNEVTHKEALSEAIEKSLLKGHITQKDLPEIENKIKEVVNHPQLLDYFSETTVAKNEHTILLDNGRHIRADRIVFLPEKTVVLEYKSGKPDSSHPMQLHQYISALKSAGLPNPTGILVYLHPLRIQTLNNDSPVQYKIF
ncbi:MAG: Dna2/Cas4 domain-containing protein, partial [Bacteroidetes bacterium]